MVRWDDVRAIIKDYIAGKVSFNNEELIKQAKGLRKLIYKIADLFIVQWESMLKIYPKAVPQHH